MQPAHDLDTTPWGLALLAGHAKCRTMWQAQTASHTTGQCVVAHVESRHTSKVLASSRSLSPDSSYTSDMSETDRRPGSETLSDPVGSFARVADELIASFDSDLSAEVPDCPGWRTRDLLVHTGRVYAAVTAVVVARATEPVRPSPDVLLADDATNDRALEWFVERRRAVEDALRDLDPSTAVWTWSSDRTGAFYRRRMVHETAVHLADVQRALGLPTRIERDVCIDGIDEYFDVMVPRVIGSKAIPSGSLHLHCTDGPGEWLAVPGDSTIQVTREHAKGAVAWRGSAQSLLLAVWGRVDGDLDIIGDDSVSTEWLALAP